MIPFLLSFLLALNLFNGNVHAETTTNPLSRNVEQLLQDLTLDENSRGIHTGIAVYNLSKDEYIYRHNAEKTYVPASNLKLFVSAAALETWGPDHRFVTEVFIDGKLNPNGIVNGNLLVKGYGDPSFALEDLQQVALDLKQKGIKQINGDLLVDESFFDTERLGPEWMWDDEVYGYSAQISALALEKNSLSVEIKPGGREGQAPVISSALQTSYVHFLNEAKTVAGKDSDIQFSRARETNVVTISGTIGMQSEPIKENLAVNDPALFAGEVWKQQLESIGIRWKPAAKVRKAEVKNGIPFVTHTSKPLHEIILELNKESDNFFAEMLTKNLGAVKKGVGSFAAGTEAIADFCKQAGMEHDYRQVDGSGLSRLNFITPEQLINLLSYVQEKEYRPFFEDSLPIAGIDGTLKSRMKGTPAENNLHAKTGSMGGVNSISGYVTAQNGDKLAFSLLINGIYKSKYATELQDKLADLMAQYPELMEPVGSKPEEKSYELDQLLDPILGKASLNGITTGIIVKSLDRQEPERLLYNRNGEKLLTPSTSLLAITGAAASELLGSDYQYKTEVFTSAPIPANGVINGDLIVKGYGDPSLQTADKIVKQEGRALEEIVQVLRQKGVRKINGNLIMDDSYFDDQRLGLGWPWDQESKAEFAQISALSVNHGAVTVTVKPGAKPGDKAVVATLPKTKSVQVMNSAKTTAQDGANTLVIERARGKNVIIVSGNVPIGISVTQAVPLEEPAFYAGEVLLEKLNEAGIMLGEKVKVMSGAVPANAVKVFELTSPALQDLVSHMLKEADAFYAEMFVKRLGAEAGLPATTEQGVTRIQTWLNTRGNNTAFDMIDGSGLTRYNLISPEQLVSVLELMAKQDEDRFTRYLDAFPIAGVEGTLRERMKGTAAENNVRAISGNMPGVSSLTGFATTRDGERLVFSIIMNGYMPDSTVSIKIQDRIAAALASYQK